MRMWQEHQSSQTRQTRIGRKPVVQDGPEIIFIPALSNSGAAIQGCCSSELPGNPISFSKRFASFGSSGAPLQPQNAVQKPKLASMGKVAIPMHNILAVEPSHEAYRTILTVKEKGLFEVSLESRNGMDILLAFLRARLPHERIMDDNASLAKSQSSMSQTSRSTKSFDVEAFTASRMAERIQHETLAEKMRRKVGKLVSSLEEGESSFLYILLCTYVIAIHLRVSQVTKCCTIWYRTISYDTIICTIH